MYATSGFLDTFIESFHHLLLFPDGGREERPRFTYAMEVDKNGGEVYHLEGNRLGLGDIPIVLTHGLADESETSPAIAWRTGVELPTGSEEKGFGNGKLDFGGGVIAQKSWGRWTATGGVDWVRAARARSFVGSGVDVGDNVDLQLGGEYRWNDDLSLLAGLMWTSPVTSDIDVKEIDNPMLSVDLGVAFDVGQGSRLILGIEEDAIAQSGPDFRLFASWSFSP